MNEMDPHSGQPVAHGGPPLEEAAGAMILVHGRGASATNILGLGEALRLSDYALLAPQAANHTWYPYSFLAPMEQNEPFLSSALRRLSALVDEVIAGGVAPERLVLLGFSQGACLSLEFVARHPRRYGGVVGFSGGLIGPPGTPREYDGSLAGTPIFLGSSDPDSHIPVERVFETDEVLSEMGAVVTTRIYPGMGHTVNEEEMAFARAIATSALKDSD